MVYEKLSVFSVACKKITLLSFVSPNTAGCNTESLQIRLAGCNTEQRAIFVSSLKSQEFVLAFVGFVDPKNQQSVSCMTYMTPSVDMEDLPSSNTGSN